MSNGLAIFEEFRDVLGTRDPKTVAIYLATMRDFVSWRAEQPGGTPFHLGLLIETAVHGYLDSRKTSRPCAPYPEQGAFRTTPFLPVGDG
ncbi:hypothetical protein [Ktedonobacter robiniae]|uniref:Core-binding (CB) domain-containing protein n=1 Tax=Ktedonobacter robiniae TaxID=2778365 RepID=A0ABQ3V126_9CHLR|nr:hypothetical protein [Ktedonobacter robiniae]GHO58681.1 hypothetical protein KSB_71560 [Ktedonobacter robiniae]